MWVASSPWGFSEMTIQPARHECHACCPLRAGSLAFQPVVDNTRGTHVEQVLSSFQKILRGSQLTWYSKCLLQEGTYYFWWNINYLCQPELSKNLEHFIKYWSKVEIRKRILRRKKKEKKHLGERFNFLFFNLVNDVSLSFNEFSHPPSCFLIVHNPMARRRTPR